VARTGRPNAELVLAEDERDQLMRWSRRAKSSQALALRSRIVLACAQHGVTNKQVAEDLGVAPNKVNKWCRRFVATGSATVDPAGQGRRSAGRDARAETGERNALVADVDGGTIGTLADDDRPDLAPVRPHTASGRTGSNFRPTRCSSLSGLHKYSDVIQVPHFQSGFVRWFP
jgi:transposase-like protein